MKKLVGAFLFICVASGLALAKQQAPATSSSAKAPSATDAVKQLEHDWLDAEKAGDWDKLNGIIADDWVVIGPGDETQTKKQLIDAYKSGKSKLNSFEIGPMTVFANGSTAVVQGSDTEKSTADGKDTSGKYAWMDVFVKRNGNWVAVRSALNKVR
jgi:ketosteroid isomerase-like protein